MSFIDDKISLHKPKSLNFTVVTSLKNYKFKYILGKSKKLIIFSSLNIKFIYTYTVQLVPLSLTRVSSEIVLFSFNSFIVEKEKSSTFCSRFLYQIVSSDIGSTL